MTDIPMGLIFDDVSSSVDYERQGHEAALAEFDETSGYAAAVVAESDRIRAAVVRALRASAKRRRDDADNPDHHPTQRTVLLVLADAFDRDADTIENGAPLP